MKKSTIKSLDALRGRLAALFGTKDDYALILLLKLCIKKNKTLDLVQLKDAIGSSSLKIRNVLSVNTTVQDIAPVYFKTHWPESGELINKDVLVHVSCDTEGIVGIDKIEFFIIEAECYPPKKRKTKRIIQLIGYDDLTKTQRYYNACSSSSSSNKVQFFIYLSTEEDSTSDDHYINISSMEMRDNITMPIYDYLDDIRAKLWDIDSDLESYYDLWCDKMYQ